LTIIVESAYLEEVWGDRSITEGEHKNYTLQHVTVSISKREGFT